MRSIWLIRTHLPFALDAKCGDPAIMLATSILWWHPYNQVKYGLITGKIGGINLEQTEDYLYWRKRK